MTRYDAWQTSTYSREKGNCVEIADLGRHVAARDSKDRSGPTLTFARPAWDAFVTAARDGEFDRR